MKPPRLRSRSSRRFRTPSLKIRRRIMGLGLFMAFIVADVRAFQIQILEKDEWTAEAIKQHDDRMELSAARGTIYDRNGIPLATSREMIKVALAPQQITEPDTVRRLLVEHLGVTENEAIRLTDVSRRWVVLPGYHEIALTRALENRSGVHFELALERFYPYGALGREILGRLAVDGHPLGGIELHYDADLTGTPGAALVRREASGRPLPGTMNVVLPPEPGHDIYLTLDYTLQQIAEEALSSALVETGAEGGDLLLLDPTTGEVLAAASRRETGRSVWSAITEPYEPGSTLKPFLVASLLAEGAVSLTDMVDGKQGRLVARGGRVINDVHGYDSLTVRQGLEKSSNVVMAQIALGIPPVTQYRYLRDFGFGTITALDFPSESSGRLRHPDRWSLLSQQSLAIGYEVSVTPLQMALAYGALAHGGQLMEPRLVRETRSRDGLRGQTYPPRRVRQVVPTAVADSVAAVLASVVETGTGTQASLGTYRVAGKTGTAKRTGDAGYEDGDYTASFAGFFPAEDPKVVVIVKLDNPSGAYYGGLTAAPVLRKTLAAALSANESFLHRSTSVLTPSPASPAVDVPPPPPHRPTRSVRLDLAETLYGKPVPAPQGEDVPVPDVVGLDIREAALRLHQAGFHVRMLAQDTVRSISPSPGTLLTPPATVEVRDP